MLSVHPSISLTISISTGKSISYDVFISGLSLALEAQGHQHYHWHYRSGDPALQRSKDEEKRFKSQQAGITLVTVPYWWQPKRIDSLVASIRERRPDVLVNYDKDSIKMK